MRDIVTGGGAHMKWGEGGGVITFCFASYSNGMLRRCTSWRVSTVGYLFFWVKSVCCRGGRARSVTAVKEGG